MANITVADITKLRKNTGAGMMDCKQALTEANGDFDKAKEIIREKGKLVAAKRSDREASEGVVLAKTTDDAKTAAMIVLRCETDFVAKNADFVKLAENILDISLKNKPATLDELKQLKLDNGVAIEAEIENQTGIIGEKLDLSYYDMIEAEQTTAYIHPGNKVASIVGLNKDIDDKQIGKDVAMQVAAMNPAGIDKNDVPQAAIDKEMEFIKAEIKKEGKPDELVDKIAQGKLNKFFKEQTLLNQQFVKENKKSVQQYLQEADKDLTVKAFKQYSIAD
jgi:elongation factor Ts